MLKRGTLRQVRWLSSIGLMAVVLVPTAGTSASQAQANAFANPAFERVWQRTDLPVANGTVLRTWFWGPQAGASRQEPFNGPGGQHLVQYFDKARMEINDTTVNPNSPWYVTNGLLTVELVSGQVDSGPALGAADIPLASDTDDAKAPTYKSFASVADVPGNSGHAVASAVGKAATATINRAGEVGSDPSKATLGDAIAYAYYEPATHHNIIGAFWEFLNTADVVYEGGQTKLRLLSNPWFYATGYPVSEAYWARVKIAGQPHDVLIQAFQRRVLTYVPDNPTQWRVQMGNIGQHYYQWRYGGAPPVPPASETKPTGRIAYILDGTTAGSVVFTMAPDGTDARQIASTPGENRQPRFSADGKSIAYYNIPPGPTAHAPADPLYLDPTSRIMLTTDSPGSSAGPLGATSVQQWEGQADPAYSPNGMFLAFRGKPSGEKPGLFVANLASDAAVIPVQRLTSGEWDRQPAWSPDGKEIAYTSGNGTQDSQIWLMNADGTNAHRLTDAVTDQHDQDPLWSPDGKTLVFASDRITGKYDIMQVSEKGEMGSALTYAEGSSQRYPSYSPDGKWLAFSSDKDGTTQVVISPADGSRWITITKGPGTASQPNWGQ